MICALSFAVAITGCGDDGGTGDASADTGGGDTGGGDTGGGDTGGGDTGMADGGGGGGMFCQEMCEDDMDCQIGGSDTGFTCMAGRCMGSAGGCADDNACVAQFSGWTEGCAADGDCSIPTSVCIDVGGEGLCALPPPAGVGCVGGQEEAMYPNIDGSGDETVCANTAYECRSGTCVDPCEADADCSAIPGRPVCNTGTGMCECADDAQCADVPGASVCVDGQCRCAADGDCSDVDNANTCFDGACGCSDVSICMGDTAFDGTSFVCEGV